MAETFITIDFGVNFSNSKRYPEEILKKLMADALDNGVDKVVCIANDIKEAHYNLVLAKKYDNLYFTLGIHPHSASNFKDSDLTFIENHAKDKKCFGIGECGLDFNRNYSPKDKQIEVFRKQIELAKKINVKLYLHCRDAYADFIDILKEYNYFNGLVHCFTGSVDQAVELTSLGFKLGITGWLFDRRRNKDLVCAVKDKRITLDMLVVETDAPYMPIPGDPKKESVPRNTRNIVEEIARLKCMDVIKCGQEIYDTSLKFLQQ